MCIKLAVIGNGKTGSRITRLLSSNAMQLNGESPELEVFNTSRPIHLETLRHCDAAIVFVPGEGLKEMIPILLESGIPVVCGTTGFEYSSEFQTRVSARGAYWVVASNFSPLMCALQKALETLGQNPALEGSRAELKETHHVNKKDAPSGTALRWKEWYGRDSQIESLREGDVVGEHTLTISTQFENLTIHHSALSRDLFASGAIQAANHLLKLIESGTLKHGVYTFSELEEEMSCMN